LSMKPKGRKLRELKDEEEGKKASIGIVWFV
jgi:hypothetical protein